MTIDDVYGSGDFYYGGLFFIFVYLTQRCLLNMSANMVFFFFFFSGFLVLAWIGELPGFLAEISSPTLQRGASGPGGAVGFTKNDVTTLTQRFII